MRFLIDEMFPAAVVGLLSELGHDAVHVFARGLGARPDADITVACVLKSRLRPHAMAADLAALLHGWASTIEDPLPGMYWPH